jgi:hypothetical protein
MWWWCMAAFPHDLVSRRDVGQTLPEVALGDIGATTQIRVGGVA